MFIRRFPVLVTVALWASFGLYGFYWAIQNAIWIRKRENELGLTYVSRFKVLRNVVAIYFLAYIALYLSQIFLGLPSANLQMRFPYLIVLNVIIWFSFLGFLLNQYLYRIEQIEEKLGIEDKINFGIAWVLVPVLYSTGTYLQSHINRIDKKLKNKGISTEMKNGLKHNSS